MSYRYLLLSLDILLGTDFIPDKVRCHLEFLLLPLQLCKVRTKQIRLLLKSQTQTAKDWLEEFLNFGLLPFSLSFKFNHSVHYDFHLVLDLLVLYAILYFDWVVRIQHFFLYLGKLLSKFDDCILMVCVLFAVCNQALLAQRFTAFTAVEQDRLSAML